MRLTECQAVCCRPKPSLSPGETTGSFPRFQGAESVSRRLVDVKLFFKTLTATGVRTVQRLVSEESRVYHAVGLMSSFSFCCVAASPTYHLT